MSNLLDSLRSYITPDLISQASKVLGESENGISKAINSIFCSILGGIISKEHDTASMNSIVDLVSESSANSSETLHSLEGILPHDISDNSSNFLTVLFGNKLGGVTDLIANQSGLKSYSVNSLFGLLSPLVLSFLKKENFSISSLLNTLHSQKQELLASVPVGFSSLVGISNSIDYNSATTTKNSDTGYQSGQGFPKWIVPLILILGALLALYYFTKDIEEIDHPTGLKTSQLIDSLEDNVSPDVNSMLDSLSSTADSIAFKASKALGEFIKFKLPNGVELNAPSKGVENQLVSWLNDKTKAVDKTTWFNFDRLLFETGKSTLKSQSQDQLKNIAEIMKAYPSLQIKLGGYTDNIGNKESNLKLSDSRAKAVMQELVKLGIDNKRLSAEGYGDAHPVASNDTEEGRSQNRRIAIRITKK